MNSYAASQLATHGLVEGNIKSTDLMEEGVTIDVKSCPFACLSLLIVVLFGAAIHNFLVHCCSSEWLCSNQGRSTVTPRVLFLTAHPDDECMFLGPAITSLTKPGLPTRESKKRKNIHLLCLSDGNYEGLGMERRQELVDSCNILGLDGSNVQLHSGRPQFEDGPDECWEPLLIADVVRKHIERLKITHLVTFDSRGISGHPNHCALYEAALLLNEDPRLCPALDIYVLETINKARAYSVFMDAFQVGVQALAGSAVRYCACSWADRRLIRRAMEAHASQYVWFRRLHVLFSRYLFINTFRRLERGQSKKD